MYSGLESLFNKFKGNTKVTDEEAKKIEEANRLRKIAEEAMKGDKKINLEDENIENKIEDKKE